MSDKHPGCGLKKGFNIIFSGTMIILLISIFLAQKYSPLLRRTDSSEQLPPREIISSSLPVDLLWQIEIDEAVSSAPLLTEDTIIVLTELALYGLDPTTGRQRWRYASGPHPSPPPIVASGEKVIYGEQNNIFALDLGTGEVIWRHRIKSNDVESIVANQKVVYVAAQPHSD